MKNDREANWKSLENEFGFPIKDIITDLLFNPYVPLTYADASAVLNIHRNTLHAWRKTLGIKKRAPVRYTLAMKFVDFQARKKGYLDIGDAIGDLKLNKKMNVGEIANFLKVSTRSIIFYTPDELKNWSLTRLGKL